MSNTKHLDQTNVDDANGDVINLQQRKEGDIPLTSYAIDRELKPSCPPRYGVVLLENLEFSNGHIVYSIRGSSYVNPLWKTKFQYFSSLKKYLNFIDVPFVIKNSGEFRYFLCIDFMNSDQNLEIIVRRTDSM